MGHPLFVFRGRLKILKDAETSEKPQVFRRTNHRRYDLSYKGFGDPEEFSLRR